MQSNKDISILIADDELNMRRLLATILRGEGYQNVQFAADGQQAMAMLSGGDFDIKLAFLDISMPGYSGLEVMSAVKTDIKDCFLVVISAYSGLNNVISALDVGAQGFIVKPYAPQKIHDILKKFESRMALNRRAYAPSVRV